MNKTYIKTNLTAFSMAGLFCFFISTANGQEMTFDVNNDITATETDENLKNESKSNHSYLSDIEYNTIDIIEKGTEKNEKQPAYKNTNTKNEEQKTNKESASGKTKTTGANESESVLSFNILYYIIQKFKFTEITDQ